jgi:acyl-CoA synthetase (AMP-forming)/AMP-acid ligase II
VPSDDPQRGETIVACISASGEITAQDVRQYALSKLPAWQVPRQWWFVEGLEPNGRGKLSRSQWRERYLERARTEPPRAHRPGSKTRTHH